MFILNFNILYKYGMVGNFLINLWMKFLFMLKLCVEIKCWKLYIGKDKIRDNEYNYILFFRKDLC